MRASRRHAHAERVDRPCHRPSPSRSRSTRRPRAASTGPARSCAWRGADRRDSRAAADGWHSVSGRRAASRARPRAYAERGLPRSVRGRYSVGARGGDASLEVLLRASDARFGPAAPDGLPRSAPRVAPDDPAVARRREPSAGNGLPRRESLAAGELDVRSPSAPGAARTGSPATLATPGGCGGWRRRGDSRCRRQRLVPLALQLCTLRPRRRRPGHAGRRGGLGAFECDSSHGGGRSRTEGKRPIIADCGVIASTCAARRGRCPRWSARSSTE